MFVIPGLVCPTSLAGGQSWEKLWFSTTLFEELCKHIVLSNWAEEESSGWEGRTWEGRGWNLWWEHTQWGQEGHSFCFTHTAFIQACQSHPHLCHFQKTSQNSHLLTVPWDCKIKSCPNPLSPEAILSELWAAIHGFGIPQYTQFYHRVVELEHFLFWSVSTSHCFILFLLPLLRGYQRVCLLLRRSELENILEMLEGADSGPVATPLCVSVDIIYVDG